MDKKIEFEKSFKLINKIFQIKNDIPNQVFKESFSGYLFQDFNWAMSASFWDGFIQKMTTFANDDYVLTAVLDPDPQDDFFNEFGCYNFINFSTNILGKEYFNILETGPKDSPADAILFNSEIVVWIPSSEKWAMWGNRSYGICILAFYDREARNFANSLIKNWVSADNALINFIRPNFNNELIFQGFKNTFLSSYIK